MQPLGEKLYALYDVKDSKRHDIRKVTPREAKELNSKNYGIFWTPNDFDGARRKENLLRINYWYCDIDGGDKEEQLKLIDRVITPSIVVESKNGYHCYWKAKNATEDNFERIERGIITKLNGDVHCKDVSRLLRVPNFYHCKDPNDKFLVRYVNTSKREYTEEFMLFHFPYREPKIESYDYSTLGLDYILNEENWEKVFKLSSIVTGGRNSMLKDQVYKAYMMGLRGNDLVQLSLRLNEKLADPLPRREVLTMSRRLR
jgi:hypothetical protein